MRCALILALAAACGGAPAVATPKPLKPSPWPMFRGDPSHAGDYRARPTPQWKLRWSIELGERIDASAVITGDGRAIVATRSGTVVALAMADGEERARTRLGGGVWASPALVSDVVVVAAKDSVIRGLNWQTLEPVWSFDAPSASFSGITAVAGVVYLVSGTELLAIEATTGKLRWRRSLGAASFTSPAFDAVHRQLVVGTRSGDVQAYDLDGKLQWDVPTSPNAHNDGSPCIAGHYVLIGSNDNGLHAFDLADGRRIWKAATTNWVVSTAAVANGTAYFGDDGGRLRAISVSGGGSVWQGVVGDDLASSPTLVGTLLVHGAHDGQLHAWNPETGEPLEPIDAGAAMYASPAIDIDGAIVIGTHSGRVVAVH
jgi:outer membrane protein assembly factor BamB